MRSSSSVSLTHASTTSQSQVSAQGSLEELFDGIIEPSDQAYVDVFLEANPAAIDLKRISIISHQNQTYCEANQSYTTIFHHELQYKGETIWRVETSSKVSSRTKRKKKKKRHQAEAAPYSTTCNVLKGYLEVKVTKIGDTKWSETRKLDLLSLIRASAAAYQLYALEDEIGQQYELLNRHDFEIESVKAQTVERDNDDDDSLRVLSEPRRTKYRRSVLADQYSREAAERVSFPPSSKTATPSQASTQESRERRLRASRQHPLLDEKRCETEDHPEEDSTHARSRDSSHSTDSSVSSYVPFSRKHHGYQVDEDSVNTNTSTSVVAPSRRHREEDSYYEDDSYVTQAQEQSFFGFFDMLKFLK